MSQAGYIVFLPNIKYFKDNPYLKNLPEVEYEKENKSLLPPCNNGLFIDDDGFKWLCKIDEYGNITYKSKEKELEDKTKKNFKKMLFGFISFDVLYTIGMIILYIIVIKG